MQSYLPILGSNKFSRKMYKPIRATHVVCSNQYCQRSLRGGPTVAMACETPDAAQATLWSDVPFQPGLNVSLGYLYTDDTRIMQSANIYKRLRGGTDSNLVHHSLLQVLRCILERCYIVCSCGC